MAKKKIPNYTVIKDTREQRGWIFEKDDEHVVELCIQNE